MPKTIWLSSSQYFWVVIIADAKSVREIKLIFKIPSTSARYFLPYSVVVSSAINSTTAKWKRHLTCKSFFECCERDLFSMKMYCELPNALNGISIKLLRRNPKTATSTGARKATRDINNEIIYRPHRDPVQSQAKGENKIHCWALAKRSPKAERKQTARSGNAAECMQSDEQLIEVNPLISRITNNYCNSLWCVFDCWSARESIEMFQFMRCLFFDDQSRAHWLLGILHWC